MIILLNYKNIVKVSEKNKFIIRDCPKIREMFETIILLPKKD